MDERRRFQIALGGLASTVFIAGLFVRSAPPVTYPAVPSPRSQFRLPPVSPGSIDVADCCGQQPPPDRRPITARAARAIERRVPARLVTVQPVRPSAPAVSDSPPSAVSERSLPSRAPAFVPALAPATETAPVAVAAEASQPSAGNVHGPVTGAFVSAGKEVGRGFRSAGRALRSIF